MLFKKNIQHFFTLKIISSNFPMYAAPKVCETEKNLLNKDKNKRLLESSRTFEMRDVDKQQK